AVSKGALMGARGNSGVILSQLWRGFSRGVHGKDILDGPTLVKAFSEARDTAYKGVVRPGEGIVLHPGRDAAACVRRVAGNTNDERAADLQHANAGCHGNGGRGTGLRS